MCNSLFKRLSFQSNPGTLERSGDGDQSTMLTSKGPSWKEGTCHNAVLFSVSYCCLTNVLTNTLIFLKHNSKSSDVRSKYYRDDTR